MNASDKSDPELKFNEVELPLKIESSIMDVVNQDLFSGVIVVAKADKIIYQSNHGFANIPLKTPNDLDTKFNLGSMNKMFTSIAIAKLVLEEKLSFENSVADVLPDASIDQSEKIKIHHLLTHTSGLGSFFTPEYMKNKKKYLTIGDLLPIIEKDTLSFSPGKRFQYSNSGFEVLGMIIEQLSGMSYFDFVKEKIFLHSGMKNTDSYRIDEQISNIAEGYTRMSMKDPDIKEELRSNKQMSRIKGSAAGGGYSSANDLILFSKALFSYKLLSEKLTKFVLKGKIKVSSENENLNYAYGFSSHNYGSLIRYGHNGGAPGINSFFGVYQPVNYSLIVLSNFDPPSAERVANKIHNLIVNLE